jgi:energy-coupling factor transporter ATP-binding protein EcfA2
VATREELAREVQYLERLELLQQITFGETVAEEETFELRRYFTKTSVWTDLSNGKIDLVFGPKGSGKSALYLLLADWAETALKRRVYILTGEKLNGTPAFRQIAENSLPTELAYDGMWKLYFLTLIGKAIEAIDTSNPAALRILKALREADLLDADAKLSLPGVLSSVREYLRKLIPTAIEGRVQFDPATLMPSGVAGRIILGEPTHEQRKRGIVSVDDLLGTTDECLASEQWVVWILLDRLDTAFAYDRSPESRERERLALASLFRTYNDFRSYQHISLKVFLRSDIWEVVLARGIPEADHMTRKANIKWTKPGLVHVAAKRIAENEVLLGLLGISAKKVLGSYEEQETLFHSVFPRRMEGSALADDSIDWIIAHTRDGRNYNAPRDFIGVMNEAKAAEIRSLEMGQDRVPSGRAELISAQSVRDAVKEISDAHLRYTLFNEYPEVRSWIEALQDREPLLRLSALASIWGMSEADASERAEFLHEIGLLSTVGARPSDEYWIPLLFRPALGIDWESE